MGKTSDSVGDLRFQHYDSGEIHIHDDSHGLKFVADGDDFKEQVEEIFENLEDTDGIVKIKGTSKEVLYICKEGGNFHMFVAKNGSKKSELKKFLRKL